MASSSAHGQQQQQASSAHGQQQQIQQHSTASSSAHGQQQQQASSLQQQSQLRVKDESYVETLFYSTE
jgi:hypothetical protein